MIQKIQEQVDYTQKLQKVISQYKVESQQKESEVEEIKKNHEMEVKIFKDRILQLINVCDEKYKGKAIYIPHKTDKVDIALAEFINQLPERNQLKILFVRESEGVYIFGKSRVHVKVEKGD